MRESTRRFIDVREELEYAAEHIEGTELVPLSTLSKKSATWDKREPLTIVCRSGQRATKARAILVAMHFDDVDVLPGGILWWRSEGKPVVTSNGVQASNPRSGWIVEGLVILVSLALASSVSPWFLAITALAGMKLIFAK